MAKEAAGRHSSRTSWSLLVSPLTRGSTGSPVAAGTGAQGCRPPSFLPAVGQTSWLSQARGRILSTGPPGLYFFKEYCDVFFFFFFRSKMDFIKIGVGGAKVHKDKNKVVQFVELKKKIP